MKLFFMSCQKLGKNTHWRSKKGEKNKGKKILEHQRNVTEKIKSHIELKVKFTSKDLKYSEQILFRVLRL